MYSFMDSIATLWLQNDRWLLSFRNKAEWNFFCHPGTRLKAAVIGSIKLANA